jgi:hypothetical protein
MRSLKFALASLAVLVVLPSQAWGQFNVGPYLAYHDDADLGIGGFVGIPLPAIDEDLSFLASFGIFFPDDRGSRRVDVDYWELNADGLYAFPLENTTITPWALAGINIAHGSVVVDSGTLLPTADDDTEIGVNLGGGVTFGTGPVSPFAGVKFELGGGEGAVIFGGLTFTVGGESQ